MRRALLPLLFVLLLIGCRSPVRNAETFIYRPDQVGEPVAFWAKLANNAELEASCRRVCVLELFRRHVRPGMTLGAVAAILDNPTWLEQGDVSDFAVCSGYVPLPLLTGEAAFGIAVLARPLQQGWIMIKVEGDCTKAEFVSALKGGAESKMRDRHITAIAIMEPHPR